MVSGNLGLAIHGPRADRALAACPPADPWCALAEADYTLFVGSLGLPVDPQRAVEQARFAAPALPGPARARLVWAGAAPLQDLDPEADGLSAAVAAGGGRWLPGPGTWVLGLGLVGAPGLGLGGTVRFFHPDLGLVGSAWMWAWWPPAAASCRLRGSCAPGPRFARLAAGAGRRPYDVYGPLGGRRTRRLATVEASAAPGIRVGQSALWLGPQLRLDWEGPWLRPAPLVHGHGARGGWTWEGTRSGRGAWLGVEAEGALADYAHLDVVVDGRRYGPAPVAPGRCGRSPRSRPCLAPRSIGCPPPEAASCCDRRQPDAFAPQPLAVTVLEWRLRGPAPWGCSSPRVPGSTLRRNRRCPCMAGWAAACAFACHRGPTTPCAWTRPGATPALGSPWG